jgi:hypothetical protein
MAQIRSRIIILVNGVKEVITAMVPEDETLD